MRFQALSILLLTTLLAHGQKVVRELDSVVPTARFQEELPSTTVYYEGFENCEFPSLPTGWSSYSASNEAFVVGTGGTAVGQANENGFWQVPLHGLFAMSNDDACNCDKSQDRLVSPQIDLSSIDEITLRFEAYHDGSGGQEARVDIRCAGKPWTTIYSLTPSVSWKLHQFDVPTPYLKEGFQFRFYYSDQGSYASGLAIDNVILYQRGTSDLIMERFYTRSEDAQGSGQFPKFLPLSQARFAHLNFSATALNESDTIAFVGMRVHVTGPRSLSDTVSNYLLDEGERKDIQSRPRTKLTPYEAGSYQVHATLPIPGFDVNSSNNATSFDFQVVDTIYSHLPLSQKTPAGVWIQESGERFGSSYYFFNADTIEAVKVRIHPASDPGVRFRFKIFSYDTLTSSSYSTSPVEVQEEHLGKDIRVPLHVGISKGRYVLTIERETSAGRLIIGAGASTEATDSNALTKKVLQDWKPFPYFPMMQVVMQEIDEVCSGHIQFSVKDETCPNTNDGAIETEVLAANEPFMFNWSNGAGNVPSIANLSPGLYDLIVNDAQNCLYEVRFEIASADTIAVVPDFVFDSCSRGDGAASLEIVGGLPPYSILWDGTLKPPYQSNLDQGPIELTITDDNNCSIDTTIVVPGTSDLGVAFAISRPGCNASNGMVSFTPFGTAPFSYEWNTGDTTSVLDSIPSGIYLITIQDSIGCTEVARAFVNDSNAANVNVASITDVTCPAGSDGAIQLNVSGGTGSLTYAWNHGATTEDVIDIGSGTYRITITDQVGCKSFAQAVVEEDGTPMVLSFNAKGNYCLNDSSGRSQIIVNGGIPPYAYNWSNGSSSSEVNDLPAGTYYVTVADQAGCPQSDSIVIAGGLAFFVKLDSVYWDIDTNGKDDGKLYTSTFGGTPPYEHLWNGSIQSEDLINVPVGLYALTVTDQLGCISSLEYLLEHGPTLVSDLARPQVRVFPNPAKIGQSVRIESDRPIVDLQVRDIHGRLVMDLTDKVSASRSVSTSNFPLGIYVLSARHSDNSTRDLILVIGR